MALIALAGVALTAFAVVLALEAAERFALRRREQEYQRTGPDFCVYCFTGSQSRCPHPQADAMRRRREANR